MPSTEPWEDSTTSFVLHQQKHLEPFRQTSRPSVGDRTITTAHFQEWWQFRFIVSKLEFLACFWLCFERFAWCLVEHLGELRLTSVMHSVEPKPLARLSGITICSENGCRQQLWGKEATLMVSFRIVFSHQPSCFNGNGMVYLRFLVEEYFSEDACLLKCWAYAAELHQVGWMEPTCHLVIFNRTRLFDYNLL